MKKQLFQPFSSLTTIYCCAVGKTCRNIKQIHKHNLVHFDWKVDIPNHQAHHAYCYYGYAQTYRPQSDLEQARLDSQSDLEPTRLGCVSDTRPTRAHHKDNLVHIVVTHKYSKVHLLTYLHTLLIFQQQQ